MSRTLHLLFFALLLLSRSAPAANLVTAGRAEAEIVIAAKPARMTRLAADELQTYVQKISGATLPIVSTPTGSAIPIYVGESQWTDPLDLSTKGLRYGAFRMAAGSDWLALLGPDKDFEPIEPWGRSRQYPERDRINRAWDEITGDLFWNPFHSLYMYHYPDLDVWAFDDRGTLHAVHAFLRQLGVRWYFPGELGEVVPQQADIPLPAPTNHVVRPDYKVRDIGWWYMFLPVAEDDVRWRLRLGLHRGHDVVGITQRCHGMKYVHRREEMKQAHREFYALWNGERAVDHKGAGAPCLSSELLFQKHVAYVRAVFDHFDEPMVSIDMVDGYSRGVCGCAQCRGKATPDRAYRGGMSDYVWGYVNRVAQELYKSHPDRRVSGLAYGRYTLPPEQIERMSPNLVLIFMSPRRTLHEPGRRAEFEQLLDAWGAKLRAGTLFSFENVMYNRVGGIPVYFPHQAADYLRAFEDIFDGELYSAYEHFPRDTFDWNALAVAHLDLYVTSRLWWDTRQDVDALLEEFYTLFYGPARDEMKAFIEYCEQNYARMRHEAEPIGRALELIAAAQDAAAPGSIYAQRITLVADYVKPLHALREQLARARKDVPRARVLYAEELANKTLDGNLDDWPEVRRAPLRNVETGQHIPARQNRTIFQVFRAKEALYFGIRCLESDMAHLQSQAKPHRQEDIRNGDFVELLLETTSHSYYRITVDPAGRMLEADMSGDTPETGWSSGGEAAVHHDDDSWSVEIRVPVAGEDAAELDPLSGVDGRMPGTTFTWYFNVCRQRVRDGVVDRTAFSPTGTNRFAVLSRFAELWSK